MELNHPQEGEIWGSEPPVHSDAAYRQITLAKMLKKFRFLGICNP